MKNIAILGSTGSIGASTLDIVEHLPLQFRVVGLAAGSNMPLLVKQIEKFKPRIVSLKKKKQAEELKTRFKKIPLRIVFGPEGTEEVAGFEENEVVVSGITGIDGLRPTLAAVQAGLRVALANKESMVVGGAILQAEAFRSKAQIIPVDSEHSGIFQCIAKEKKKDVRRVILTASGGPFFQTPLREIADKPVEEALAHPRWKMGQKVTIDSATLMNKGLELIEARWLFGLSPAQLEILIHPQSIVHSLVEMRDGSVLAQLSPTDMRIPIQYALTYPRRENAPVPSLELSQVRTLEFYEPDEKRYPLIKVARRALEEEKSYPVALNAANEVAVASFLDRKIKFSAIAEVVAGVLDSHRVCDIRSLDDIFEVDRIARKQALSFIQKRL